ncbi:unnamed protein product [Chondrus crispus]|uniref:Uncharacterized protein n=1 Tax=Chondrus crispus TaxID=2769 RepID=S0F2W9_CHOCR|nr:unnamed protein product [Chondrus crispus]CDF77470.1 unnamed protein product [Chondrus crispus]|eukprot:XP_005712344.1 unnamed protein product [Chondrus crispus]
MSISLMPAAHDQYTDHGSFTQQRFDPCLSVSHETWFRGRRPRYQPFC